MKAFAIGLIFLIAAGILAGIGILLFPLIIVFGFFLRMVIALIFTIFCIWLLGKLVIFGWENISKKKPR